MTTISDETRAATVNDLLANVAVVRAIGNTPLLRLSRLAERRGISPSVEIWLKAEWVNPGGSVKDRPALGIVRAALERGLLGEGKALLDSTSGNTGIAYAMLGAAIGFRSSWWCPAAPRVERKQILAAYGATIIESDPYDGSDGAIRHVREMVAADPDRYFYADQYGHPANPAAHFAHDRTGDLEPDRQPDHALRRRTRHDRHLDGHRALPEAAESRPSSWSACSPPSRSMGIEGLKHLPTAIVPAIYDA